MLEKMNTQQRILLATAVSFLFFIAYDIFLGPKQSQTVAKKDDVAVKTQPNVSTQAPQASTQETKETGSAPAVTATPQKPLVTVELPSQTILIDHLGRFEQVTMKEVKYDTEGESLHLLAPHQTHPLELRFSDQDLNEEAFEKNYNTNVAALTVTDKPQTVTLTQTLSKLFLTKEITFFPDGHYELKITLSNPYEYFVTPGYRPDVLADMITVHGLLVEKFDKTTEIIEDEDATGFESFRDATLVSSFDRYYATMFFGNDFDVWVNKVGDSDPLAFVKGAQTFKLKGYVGPKEVRTLRAIQPGLEVAVEYGIFTFMAVPTFVLLDWIYQYTGNWGWAIIIITILIRIVLFPLSAKGMISMQKLKDLAPKIKEIQAKYKGDPQKLQMHTMDLYKKHGANPLGGCLPFLLQIPVFFAIYRVLANAIELKGAEWFYISDLSVMDPYFILPVLMGASMYYQQKITPSNFTDPMQEKIFKFLPVIFTFFFFTFPAGLVLYWFVNNLLSIAQQYLINKHLDAKKLVQKAEHNEKN
jgi:YidC/Oxa1 family membrane protein insertase